jgi:hypothetical protein
MRRWLPAVLLSLFVGVPSFAANGPVDLELSLAPATFGVTVNVRNNGPSNATEAHFLAPLCREPFALAAGETQSFVMNVQGPTLAAKVTQAETDTNPANSRATWQAANSILSGIDLFAGPATARAGETGTLFLVPFFPVDV